MTVFKLGEKKKKVEIINTRTSLKIRCFPYLFKNRYRKIAHRLVRLQSLPYYCSCVTEERTIL